MIWIGYSLNIKIIDVIFSNRPKWVLLTCHYRVSHVTNWSTVVKYHTNFKTFGKSVVKSVKINRTVKLDN